MLKKILCLTLCLLMCATFVGCKKDKEILSVDMGDDTVSSSETESKYINPLTGEATDEEIALQRPVAIMVNNISIAQPVQTGLNDADIVYETEVEGGITRLLAVFQNFKDVKKVGTVRSARYVYIDLAKGHNAIYAHHGSDPSYARPHLKDLNSIEVTTNNGGARDSNGLASEHTLYANGSKVWNSIKSMGYDTTVSESVAWQNFADEEAPVKFEYTTSSVTIPFSNSYKTTFKYNDTTGKYTRFFNSTERKDYVTKESITIKNIFVLNTTISDYSDGYHRNINLSSGDGYYFVNGTYTKIKWTKGNASDGFKFTNEDGTPLTVNPGNSWVCIADKSTSQPIIGE